MLGDYYKPGAWNAICDVCGLRFKSDQMMKRWDGLMVDRACFETRHPQDFLRVPREDISTPWARPDPEPEYLYICYLWGRSAYADLAEADCAQADYAPSTYQALLKLKNGT